MFFLKITAMEKLKNEKRNPESYKLIYFQIGMIVALLAVLYAFEFKSIEKYELTDYDFKVDNTPIEFISPTVHKKPPPPPPEPIGELKVDLTNMAKDEGVVIDAATNQSEPIPYYEPVFEPDPIIEGPEIIVEFPSKRAQFPGGYAAMMSFMRENISYPTYARETNISGTVYLQFVVEKNGSITSIEVLREVNGGCTEEAIRVLELMPLWEPGLQNGRPVRSIFNLPIKFSLR